MSRFALPTGAALIVTAVVTAGSAPSPSPSPTGAIQFVVTSDAHYGLTRASFRGRHNVDAHVVNAALVAGINTLPDDRFPLDRGLEAGQPVGPVDFVVEAGDITNRQEHGGDKAIQAASVSWSQFASDYIDGLRLLDASGARSRLFLVPGNHEASNAVGFHQPMSPLVDRTPLIEIYNRMLRPEKPLTTTTFDYERDRVFYTQDVGGIHFVFLHIWPDSVMRAKLEHDLASVSRSTPVVIFTHDPPEAEGKHFVNPNGAHDINATDQFENLLADRFADGRRIDVPTTVEQGQFEAFLAQHPNITAYFHGNSNWHQSYEWNGPKRSVRLHVFRVDSPMKGAVSSIDETRLSFEVATLDPVSRSLTVRECLWNADPAHPQAGVVWGDSVTVALDPRPTAH